MRIILDQDALSEFAWVRINEAMFTGKITLPERKEPVILDSGEIVKILQWLATVKTKKPKVVSNPEDFILAATGSEDIDE